jgi:hypothetical protein
VTLHQDTKPVYGPYGSWPSVCDRTALDEIDLYGDLLSFIAAAERSADTDADGAAGRLSWEEIDAALGVARVRPRADELP